MQLSHYQKILEYATSAHGEQKRKYTGDPYIVHPIAVAEIVKGLDGDEAMIYAALLHDVLEDTPVTSNQLLSDLCDLGIPSDLAFDIHSLVVSLTDVYTKANFPTLNRSTRKDLEADRLGRTSARSQLIKFADMQDNTSSITEHDPKFSEVYLREKKVLLDRMTKLPGLTLLK